MLKDAFAVNLLKGEEMLRFEAAPRELRALVLEYRKGIAAFTTDRSATSYIVYRGDQELLVDGTRVLPVETFIRRLHNGDILG